MALHTFKTNKEAIDWIKSARNPVKPHVADEKSVSEYKKAQEKQKSRSKKAEKDG